MTHALVIGGTRFIGRHAVEELLAHDYDVTLMNRGRHPNPFADDDRVDRVAGDRTDLADLERAAAVDPEVVLDVVAYHPGDVRAAARTFTDVDAYVYVSSGAAYGEEAIPKREGETPLEPCTDAQETDDTRESYGARKAEGDRMVAAAARCGLPATSVRPCNVYGPHDYTGRLDYWLGRVARHDRVVVPGDGTNLWHQVYVEDVARALRVVAERGEPGEAYNVGDRRLRTLGELVERVADALETDVEPVHAGARDLAAADLEPGDFPLYRSYPHVLDTCKLEGLGWSSTAFERALARTVAEFRESDRDGRERGPDRAAEERVLAALEAV